MAAINIFSLVKTDRASTGDFVVSINAGTATAPIWKPIHTTINKIVAEDLRSELQSWAAVIEQMVRSES